MALLRVGRALKGAAREEVRAAVTLLANSQDADTRSQARDIIATIDKFGDYITGWQVCGPYVMDGYDFLSLIHVAFAPEQKPEDVRWRLIAAGTDAAKPIVLDLAGLYAGTNRVAYARTWVYSEKETDARLELGSDDAVKAWLNGRAIHTNNVARACVSGSDKVNVTLKAGWNELQLKVAQNIGPWEFCARLCNRDGSAMSGLRVDCFHE